jgi:internalin A
MVVVRQSGSGSPGACPGYEHPWEPAAYELHPTKEWLARIAPYATLVFRTLQLIVPLATAQQSSAQTQLQVMQAIVDDLPTTHAAQAQAGLAGPTRQLTAAGGAALRAVRAIIFEHDPLRAFGGLRRVQTPSGELLWVCESHYNDYDPGLPVL